MAIADTITSMKENLKSAYDTIGNVVLNNLFDKDNAQIVEAYIATSTIATSTNAKTTYMACKANTTYTIKKRNDGGNNRFTIATSSKLPAVSVTVSQYKNDNNASSMTITTNDTANYICITFYHTSETALTMQQVLDSIIIVEGTEVEPHKNLQNLSPTIESNLEDCYEAVEEKGGKLESKNHLPYPHAYDSRTISGVTFTTYDDGTILANGTATDNIFFYITINTEKNIFKLNEDYILNGCPSGGSQKTYRLMCAKRDINDKRIGSLYYDTGNGVQVPSTTQEYHIDQVYISINSGTTLNNLIFKPMIRLASITDDTYEPYELPKNLSNLVKAIESIPTGGSDIS